MVSIIVCSVNPDLLATLKANVEKTIGCAYEFLVEDNRGKNNGIGVVYNKLANRARGEYLCFIHEDITVETTGWGDILIEKSQEESCGVIGFAGSSAVSGMPYWQHGEEVFYYFIQRLKNGQLHQDFTNQKRPTQPDFEEVLVLDGMFLFCRKQVWEKQYFDEKMFPDFHLYDMDFTYGLSRQFKNYLCFSIVISHFSLGSLGTSYYNALLDFYVKWKNRIDADFLIKGCKEKVKAKIPFLVVEMMDKAKLSPIFVLNFLDRTNLTNTFSNRITAYYWVAKGAIKQNLKYLMKGK